jgi:hypothetical protein
MSYCAQLSLCVTNQPALISGWTASHHCCTHWHSVLLLILTIKYLTMLLCLVCPPLLLRF